MSYMAKRHKPDSRRFKKYGDQCPNPPVISVLFVAAQALTISLVAEIDGQVADHIAFSPVTISDGATGW